MGEDRSVIIPTGHQISKRRRGKGPTSMLPIGWQWFSSFGGSHCAKSSTSDTEIGRLSSEPLSAPPECVLHKPYQLYIEPLALLTTITLRPQDRMPQK
ncbi:unnamed protein product [Pieris macdunnoughi]|uniref:Uncharacterized protein n=1 Tax=Pieris macdunnoughi TaxID=345717 RepID=A0A821L6D7_9NEOP|nr:unnamed protein product [Pieris macdunnoughi]